MPEYFWQKGAGCNAFLSKVVLVAEHGTGKWKRVCLRPAMQLGSDQKREVADVFGTL